MSRYLGATFILMLALLLLWAGISGYLVKSSQRAFDGYLASLSQRHYQHFFELEQTDYQETFFGAEATFTVRFSVPALREAFGDLPLKATRLNGPIFINKRGIQFGAARWVVSIDQQADQVLSNTLLSIFNGEMPQAVVRFDFFDQAHYAFEAKHIHSAPLRADDVTVTGWFDLNNGAYRLQLSAVAGQFISRVVRLTAPEVRLRIQRLAQNPGMDAQSNAATIDVDAESSYISLTSSARKIPLTITSRGSIWLVDDTLSGDWQLLADNPSEEPSAQLYFNLQFREWLADGFLAYWRQQARIANLLEQADWALDEGAETPEEQDFIMSLRSDAERMQRIQNQHILAPMLKAEHSQLAVDVQLKMGAEIPARFVVSGKAVGEPLLPSLDLQGEATVQQTVLNPQLRRHLDRWSRRFWLRNYETVFETDVAVRDKRLLLNSIRVSWRDFHDELKQLLSDQ
ncbi:MAG: hypothetical protein CSB47_09175 [Proteobacteria bacterium]|nr:MAG: hypothetical protein CSB47_09175 [Pseudomonadota bacterium]